MEVGGISSHRTTSLGNAALYTRSNQQEVDDTKNDLVKMVNELWPELNSALVPPKELFYAAMVQILQEIKLDHVSAADKRRFNSAVLATFIVFDELRDSDSVRKLDSVNVKCTLHDVLCAWSKVRSVDKLKIRKITKIIELVSFCFKANMEEFLHYPQGKEMSFEAHCKYIATLCELNISELNSDRFAQGGENGIVSLYEGWKRVVLKDLQFYRELVASGMVCKDDLLKRVNNHHEFEQAKSLELSRLSSGSSELSTIADRARYGYRYRFEVFPRMIRRCIQLSALGGATRVSMSLDRCKDLNFCFGVVSKELDGQLNIITNHPDVNRIAELSQALQICHQYAQTAHQQQLQSIERMEGLADEPSAADFGRLASQFMRLVSDGWSYLKQTLLGPHWKLPELAEGESLGEDLCLAVSHSYAMMNYFIRSTEEIFDAAKEVQTDSGNRPDVVKTGSKKRRKKKRKQSAESIAADVSSTLVITGEETKKSTSTPVVAVVDPGTAAAKGRRRRRRKPVEASTTMSQEVDTSSSAGTKITLPTDTSVMSEPEAEVSPAEVSQKRVLLNGHYSRRIEVACGALREMASERSALLSEKKRLLSVKISRSQELLESTLKRCLGEVGDESLKFEHSLSTLAEPLQSDPRLGEVLKTHDELIRTLDAAHSTLFYLERYDLNHPSLGERRLVALLRQIRDVTDMRELLASEQQVNEMVDETLRCADALVGRERSERFDFLEQTASSEAIADPVDEEASIAINISLQNILPKICNAREAMERIRLCRQLIDLAMELPATPGPDSQIRKQQRNATLGHVRRYLDWLQAILSQEPESMAKRPLSLALPAVDTVHRALKEAVVAAIQQCSGGLERVNQSTRPGGQHPLLLDNNVCATFRALCEMHEGAGNRQLLDWLPRKLFRDELGWLGGIHGLLTYAGGEARQQEEVYTLVTHIQESEAMHRKLQQSGTGEGWSLVVKGEEVTSDKVEARLKNATDQLPVKVLYPALDALYLILRGAF